MGRGRGAKKEEMQGRQVKKTKTLVDAYHRPTHLGGDRIERTNDQADLLGGSFL